MDADSNKKAVRRFIEGFLNTGDPRLADEVLAADYVDHTPSDPGSAGRENVKRFAKEWLAAFPDSHSVVEDLVTEKGQGGVPLDHDRYPPGPVQRASPTGERIEVQAIGIFRIADGKIVESWDKYDTPGLWQ